MRKLTLARRLSLIVMGGAGGDVGRHHGRRVLYYQTDDGGGDGVALRGHCHADEREDKGVIFFLKRQGKFKKCCNFADVYAV